MLKYLHIHYRMYRTLIWLSRTDRRCASLCTATNKKLVTFLFSTATKINYISKCLEFIYHHKFTITTSTFDERKQWKWHDICCLGRYCFWPTSMAALSLSALARWYVVSTVYIPALLFRWCFPKQLWWKKDFYFYNVKVCWALPVACLNYDL